VSYYGCGDFYSFASDSSGLENQMENLLGREEPEKAIKSDVKKYKIHFEQPSG